MDHLATHSGTSIKVFEPDPAAVYSLAAVERLAQVPRRTILLYCRHGLVSPAGDPELGGYYFSAAAIHELRWMAQLQVNFGVNLAGIKLIANLTDAIKRQRRGVFKT